MSLFISTAHAAGEAAQQPSLMANLLMIAVFVAIFYFLIWRPQAKRAKEHRSLIESLGVGSEIVFAGGLMGKITKLDGDFAVVELSRGVEVKILITSGYLKSCSSRPEWIQLFHTMNDSWTGFQLLKVWRIPLKSVC